MSKPSNKLYYTLEEAERILGVKTTPDLNPLSLISEGYQQIQTESEKTKKKADK